ncbi:MAG: hypothetical protein JW881_12295 [Spirochaetales bacterium]|nr:hypothetical protein [Spirochaetales bacterium]
MKRTFVPVIVVFFMAAVNIAGQNYGPDEFSPFVSRLTATVSDIAIVLMWKNPKDIDGTILVYRYTEKINDENIADADVIASLEIDRESYVDYPDNTDEYYYAVLIKDKTGEIHSLFIPFRNITIEGVFIKESKTEIERTGEITELKAVVKDNTIVVTFKTTKKDGTYLLYRNTSPILISDNLIQSITPIALEGKTTYTDYPIAGIDYFYAVLDAALVKIGKIELEPGKNTLAKPVTIPIGGKEEKSSSTAGRPIPLPYISILSDVEDGKKLVPSVSSYLPEEKKLSKETEKAVDNLSRGLTFPSTPKIKMQILEIDTAATEGEATTLQHIVNGLFAKKKFDIAEEKLKDFLRVKHSDELQARASFYCGQIYYFTERYEEAFFAFLMTQDAYYYEVQPWLDACFEKLME